MEKFHKAERLFGAGLVLVGLLLGISTLVDGELITAAVLCFSGGIALLIHGTTSSLVERLVNRYKDVFVPIGTFCIALAVIGWLPMSWSSGTRTEPVGTGDVVLALLFAALGSFLAIHAIKMWRLGLNYYKRSPNQVQIEE